MNILHISTSDFGGAGNAAIRLHLGLLNTNINSKFLTYYKKNNYPEVFDLNQSNNKLQKNINFFKFGFWEGINRIKLLNRSNDFEIFTYPKSLLKIYKHQLINWADIIHLHWIAYFIDYPSFFTYIKNKPIVWTLHDMNPFTGGCHHARDCKNYLDNCKKCPQLKNTLTINYSNKIFNIKKKSYQDLNLKVITPSNWLKICSEQSSLFKGFQHFHIRNGIDTKKYLFIEKNQARKKLNLNEHLKILLFIADWLERPAKGLKFLLKAIENLQINNILIILIGKSNNNYSSKKIKQVGFIDFENLALYYSASDSLIVPSLEDNLPNTIVESHLFGTPVIGFPVGGIPEMIEEYKTGIITDDTAAEALQKAIIHFFQNSEKFNSEYIRNKAIELYDINNQVKRYIDIYLSFQNSKV